MTEFITIEELADFMNVDQLYTTSADLAQRAAETAVRKYMGQELTAVTGDVEIHDGRGRQRLRLRERPVTDLTSLVVDDTALDAADYVWSDDGIVKLIDGTYFSIGWANITVTYDHGWSVANIPADIKLVTLNVARRRYLRMGNKVPGELQSESIEGYSYSTRVDSEAQAADEITKAEKAVLDRYAVRLVP